MQSEKGKITQKNKHYDIRIRAYQYALKVIKFIDSLPPDRTAGVLSGQFLRSSTSIGANIIEAQAASSQKEFKNFLNHALKSANETKYWLALLRDSSKRPKDCTKPRSSRKFLPPVLLR
jgi:four helix bundle protein